MKSKPVIALGPVEVAILREAVRLDGLNERRAQAINVDVAQMQDLEGRGLLVKDTGLSIWRASEDGRQAIKE